MSKLQCPQLSPIPSPALSKEMLTYFFGERCRIYDDTCPICFVWRLFDELGLANRHREFCANNYLPPPSE